MSGRFAILPNGSIIERAISPQEDRDMAVHCARVYLNEARFRRKHRHNYAGVSTFHFHLLDMAGRSRRRALAIDTTPTQGLLL